MNQPRTSERGHRDRWATVALGNVQINLRQVVRSQPRLDLVTVLLGEELVGGIHGATPHLHEPRALPRSERMAKRQVISRGYFFPIHTLKRNSTTFRSGLASDGDETPGSEPKLFPIRSNL